MADAHTSTARQLWRLLEPVHAVTYFSPEPLAALKEAGYRGFWMGYFAGRAAPMGRVPAELVHAVFHNFSFDHVARAIPDAWTFAPPESALAARRDGSVRALRRQLGGSAESPDVGRVAELLARAAAHAPMEGRPLFAANRALDVPEEPLALLWHAATLLREHRGDGHVAALTAAGIGGREAHVLQAVASATPRKVYEAARNLDEEEWQGIVADLRERGILDAQGRLTDTGRTLKQDVEDQTDRLAATAYRGLSGDELDELRAILRPITAAVVASGDLPQRMPTGLRLDDRAAERP